MYDDLVKRLNDYSAEHECHGGITAEAADAIEELNKEVMMLRMECCCCCEPPKEESNCDS